MPARMIASSALCALLSVCLCQGVAAQTVGVSRKRIPGDAAASKLNGLLRSAQEAIDRKDYAAAAQSYQSYLAEQPDDANIHFQLGYTYTAMQRPNDAKAEYEKAISLDSKMAPAYLNLGLTLVDSDPNAAVADLQKAAELTPDQARPKFLLGVSLEKLGKLAAAIEQYQSAEKLDAKDFDIHFALAHALLTADRAADAESEFRAALAIRPDSGPAHWGIAQCLKAEKKRDGEAAELAAYLERQPGDTPARIERASALAELGKNDEALAELDQAAAQRPEDLPILRLRARILLAEKRLDDELPVLQKAAALAPQDPDIPAFMGHVYLEKKDYPNAVKELLAAFRMQPDSTDTLSELVIAEYLTKNYQGALQGMDLLSERESLTPGNWFVRAACYDHLGQKPQALDAYQRFLGANQDQKSDMYFEATARVRELMRELKKR
jgi:tetratricopeptide (TPR) repeat protein